MILNIKDRALIVRSVLPQFDNRDGTLIKLSILNKIQLTEDEKKQIVINSVGYEQFDISFKTAEAITSIITCSFTNEELAYMKGRVAFIDANGMFSKGTIDTYDKILCEELEPIETEE